MSIADFEEYDDIVGLDHLHGSTQYGDDLTRAARYTQDWMRRAGRVCRYPGCDVHITDRAEYCVKHRPAGREAKKLVRRFLAYRESRQL